MTPSAVLKTRSIGRPSSQRLAGVIVVAAAMATPCHAEMFKRIDEFGNVTYTNLPPPGAPQLASAPAPSARPVAQPRTVGPRVTVDEQRSRDSESRRILSDELKKESEGLAQAEGRHDADEVVRRKDNIAALQRELGRLK